MKNMIEGRELSHEISGILSATVIDCRYIMI